MTSFKIFIGDEIRRFRLETTNLTYEKFTEKLRTIIPFFHLEMRTYYEDSDEDKIVFSCEMEFIEMITHLKQMQCGELKLIKIWIEDDEVPYFVDGTSEATKLYTTDTTGTGGMQIHEQPLEETKSIQERIMSALSRLFPDNKILPYHIPSFLKDVVAVKTVGTADVEVDISVNDLTQAINEEALRLMDSNDELDLEKSRKLLESLQILTPEDPDVYYNLACTDSLLKNVQSSLEQLKNAFNHGFSNLQHMYEDKDLTFLRMHEQFQEFINYLLNSEKQQEEPQESK